MTNIKEFMQSNLRFSGNLFDHTSLPDPLGMIFQDPLDHAIGILEGVKAGKQLLTADVPYFVGYLTNHKLNALAAHQPGLGCSVIIHNSTLVLMFMACMEFGARCNAREALPNEKNGHLIVYDDKKFLPNKLLTPLRTNDEVGAVIGNFALKFEEENLLGFLLFQLAMKFIVYHEVGHIIMGHSNYANQHFGLQFSYATHAEQSITDPMLCQVMEYMADRSAIANLATYALTEDFKNEHARLLSNANIDKDIYMLRCVTISMVILCHLFYTESRSIDHTLSTYPHPALRSLWLSMELGKATTDQFDFVDVIMNTMTSTASSLHYNFESPSFSWATAFEEDQQSGGKLSNLSYKYILDRANEVQEKIYKEYGWLL